ncbi:AlkZ-related protein [Butyrivibrio sp. MC2013]|uniref:AlkZ-related protein n=1 Tax=Butyrivibrio sp. MC2013 TaxID=1280686 RepID=UPI000415B92D|nr:hypothetical protein [Butyrivibrio sp. MC2013]
MNFADDFVIRSMDDLTELIDGAGFVPFFINEIDGFSIEEHIDPGCWFGEGDSSWGAWEWKGPVIRQMNCAYGKFLKGKAMYISAEYFPDFANFRRDGYDFDARYDDGLASYYDKELFELLDANAPILSKPLKKLGDYGKGGKKGFDTMITRLQKQCYVLISDFQYARDKYGNQYGWGIAEYSTPEKFMGKKFKDNVYKKTPRESYERVIEQFKRILPYADEKMIKKILK